MCSCSRVFVGLSALALLIASTGARAQVLLTEPGPLERRARPITPDNPVPRRLSFVMPTRPPDPDLADGRSFVTLRLTLDETGSVAEIRSACCGLIATGNSLAAGNAFIDAAVDAVRQWRYEPPVDPPISFDVTMAFEPGAEPSLLAHGGMLFRPAVPPPPPPPPPPPAVDAAPWAAGAIRVAGSMRPPTKIAHVAAAYPQAARDARVEGVVVIEVRIEADGRIQHARVLRSIPMLDQSALDAVRQWLFEPTFVGGAATPVLMNVTVQFTLPGEQAPQPPGANAPG